MFYESQKSYLIAMYYHREVVCLERKRVKLFKSLFQIKKVGVVKLVNIQRSERCELKLLGVRVPSPTPNLVSNNSLV